MTEGNQPNDGIERVEGKFDPLAETRYWLPAASEQHCKRIGRKRGFCSNRAGTYAKAKRFTSKEFQPTLLPYLYQSAKDASRHSSKIQAN